MCNNFPNKLLILGNGFNRWFGLPTSYHNYKRFLERNLTKYRNCYDVYCKILGSRDNRMWADIENSFEKWLKEPKNIKIAKEFNMKAAVKERYYSLRDWVYEIRVKYKDQLKRIYHILDETVHTKRLLIWSFNYIIDYYKKSIDFPMITSPIPGNGEDKRALTQLHWLSTGNDTYIMFGANYNRIKNLYNYDSLSLNEKLLLKFTTKFNPHNINEILSQEESDFSFTSDIYNKPGKFAYEDGIATQFVCWTSQFKFNTVYFLGLSFDGQDTEYFTSNHPNCIIRRFYHWSNWKIYTSYFGGDPDDKDKKTYGLWNIFTEDEHDKLFYNTIDSIKPFVLESNEMLKIIFGKKNYGEFLEIKKKIHEM